MDGTLFQTNTVLEISLADTFGHLTEIGEWPTGEGAPIEQYRTIMGVPLPVVWETLLPNHTGATRERANEYFQEQLILNIRRGQGALYPHVEEVLQHFKTAGYRIYIASNGLPEYLQAIVEQYRLDEWVNGTFSIQQIQSMNKTDLVAFIKERNRIEQAAVVGDRLSDIQAAQGNGFLSVGCRFDFAQEEELAQADVVVDDLLELITVMKDDRPASTG